MPLVSVIIPSYNHAKYISESIQSVLDQTYQNFEIIITDDASTDESVSIIENFSDKRIKLFKHEKNEGASVASNNCILKSSGKYIAMLSSDDIWYPNKLDVQVKYLEENQEIAAVFGNVKWINEFGKIALHSNFPYRDVFKVENRSRFDWLNHFFYKGNCLNHPSSLVRREVYNQVGLLNPAFASVPDFDLWIRICLKFDIHVMKQTLLKFRRMSNETNASGDRVGNRIRNRFENKQIMDNFLNITNVKDFSLVFPEVKKIGNICSDTIPFILGQLAIDTRVDYKMQWGMEKIYSLIQNETKATFLRNEYNFTYSDFLQITQKYDPFHIAILFPDQQIQVTNVKQNIIKKFLSASKRYIREVFSIFS